MTINNGGVGTNDYGGNKEGCGNYGTIGTNNGTVISNNEGGKVEINGADGTIEINNGTVGTFDNTDDKPIDGTGNFGNISTNTGIIYENIGTVTTNAESGCIDSNDGYVGTNDKGAAVYFNYGTIGENKGTVEYNGIQWEYKEGKWVEKVDTDGNTIPAVIKNNSGTVEENYGTVETNTIDGVVYNETAEYDDNITGEVQVTGKVQKNYGTVYNRDKEDNFVATYGVEVKNTDGGAGTKLLQAVENTVVKLAELFKRDGYKLVGYDNITPTSEDSDEDADGPVAAAYALNNDPATSATEFQATRPSILKLLWEKIAGKPSASSDDPEPKTVQNNIPTSLSAGQVTVGAYVRRGNLLFRIIEVTDNDIRVATVGKLSEKSLADMMGFLKQHLSDAQIAKINGEPKLLEQELVTYFFGDSYEHIAFRAARDLFA